MSVLYHVGKSFWLALLLDLVTLFALFSRIYPQEASVENQEVPIEKWGSFTPYKTYSYDNRFYAVQTVEKGVMASVIVVSIYEAETDEFVGDFCPARSWDFWGICWESDSYNIWTQSADIGIYCYVYQDGQWIRDENAVRPEDIVSKYDVKDEKSGDRKR